MILMFITLNQIMWHWNTTKSMCKYGNHEFCFVYYSLSFQYLFINVCSIFIITKINAFNWNFGFHTIIFSTLKKSSKKKRVKSSFISSLLNGDVIFQFWDFTHFSVRHVETWLIVLYFLISFLSFELIYKMETSLVIPVHFDL